MDCAVPDYVFKKKLSFKSEIVEGAFVEYLLSLITSHNILRLKFDIHVFYPLIVSLQSLLVFRIDHLTAHPECLQQTVAEFVSLNGFILADLGLFCV